MILLPEPRPSDLALGLIAGGRGSRLGGVDKAALRVGGQTQLRRLIDAFASFSSELLLSRGAWPEPADLPDGLRCLPDRVAADGGPMAALDALSQACSKPWLLTLPIDLHAWPDTLLPELTTACASGRGVVLADASGLQPLIAVWPVAALRIAAARGLASGKLAVRELVAALDLQVLQRPDWKLQNLNTPLDLAQAGASHGSGDDQT